MTSEQIKDYFEGMRDAENGVSHKSGRSAEYDRGYASQYEFEQVKSYAGVN
jgi:hypothetical protein